MVEYDFAGAYQGHLRNQQLAVGAADVSTAEVEPADLLVERIQAQSWLPREQTLITSGRARGRQAAGGGLAQAVPST